jgi:hypothetical protein
MQTRKWTNAAGKPIPKMLLLAMPDFEFHVIRTHLEYLALPPHLWLPEPHQTFRFVYFPREGLISLIVATKNGKGVEAGIVGSESIRELPAIAV